MTRPDDVEWRRREELRSLLTALRSRRGGNGGKRLRQDDAAILSGLSTRRYAALERGTVENPPLDLIENVASGLRMTPAERADVMRRAFDIMQRRHFSGIAQLLSTAYVKLRVKFLALIPIEDAERDADTGAERVVRVRVVKRTVVSPPGAERRIRRAVGHCQLVICFGFLHGLVRFF